MFQIILAILIVFTAIALACAVRLWTAPTRGHGIGRRRPPPADPFSRPFGDMPGFTRAQLEEIARRPVEEHHDLSTAGCATPAARGSGGVFLSDAAAVSPTLRRRSRAF
jgi:hypothetical protein